MPSRRTLSPVGQSYPIGLRIETSPSGAQVTLTASPNERFVFVGWFKGDALLSSDAEYVFYMPSEDVTYTATFDPLFRRVDAEGNDSDTGDRFLFEKIPANSLP